MPTNIVTDSVPIVTNVRAALRLLGRRKAGTPLLIASTPVSAVHPEAKARKARKTVKSPPTRAVGCRDSWALGATPTPEPKTACSPAVASKAKTPKMNAYVGIAKVRPLSLMPRRFITAIAETKNTDSNTA